MFNLNCLSPFTAVKHAQVCLAAALFFLLFTVSMAHAHATVLWCYVENGQVFVEAFFMGGKKVQKGEIFVVDKLGKKILEGTTDDQGLFQFDPAVEDDMTIVLRIDTGHGTDFKITKQDFLDAAEEAAAKPL